MVTSLVECFEKSLVEWKRQTLAPGGQKRKFVLVLESADWVRKYQIWGKSPFENLLIHSVYGGSWRCFGESSRGWKEQESPSDQVFLWQQSSAVARCLFWSDRLSPDTKFTAYSGKNFAKPPQLQSTELSAVWIRVELLQGDKWAWTACQRRPDEFSETVGPFHCVPGGLILTKHTGDFSLHSHQTAGRSQRNLQNKSPCTPRPVSLSSTFKAGRTQRLSGLYAPQRAGRVIIDKPDYSVRAAGKLINPFFDLLTERFKDLIIAHGLGFRSETMTYILIIFTVVK